MTVPVLVAAFDEPFDLVAAWDDELSLGGLLVRGAKVAGVMAGGAVRVDVRVGGESVVVLEGAIAAVASIGVAATFDEIPESFRAAVDRARDGEPLFTPADAPASAPPPAEPAPEAALPLAERYAKLSVGQKINLALNGEREERMLILRDQNKTLHAYVFRNPRIQMDEVINASKSSSVSPDALKAIAEHKEWGTNVGIAAAIVRNLKSPIPVALKLLPKLPLNDIRAIAKGGAREQLVQAARKMLAGGK